MYNADTDLIFPPRAIENLADERVAAWHSLVFSIKESGLDSPDQTAFILMMARMNACATCNSDSFRAMNGCSTCARQSLKRFKGSDEELLALFNSAKDEVEQFIQDNDN